MFSISAVRRALGPAVLAVAVVAGLSACSTVAPQDGVEEQIRTQLGTETATCPDDLDGEVAKTMTCSATAGGETFDVTVTVTALEGDTINFDLERVGAVAEPASDASVGVVDGQEVAAAVSEQLTAQVGQAPDSVTCPDLPAAVGESIRCELVAGQDTLGVTVTTSSVEGGSVEFDILVDEMPS
jgi:hypothetical protein